MADYNESSSDGVPVPNGFNREDIRRMFEKIGGPELISVKSGGAFSERQITEWGVSLGWSIPQDNRKKPIGRPPKKAITRENLFRWMEEYEGVWKRISIEENVSAYLVNKAIKRIWPGHKFRTRKGSLVLPEYEPSTRVPESVSTEPETMEDEQEDDPWSLW